MRLPKLHSWRAAFGSPFVAVTAVVIALLLSWSAARIVLRAHAIYRERSAMADRIRELEAERERLRAAITALDTPEAVERLAKERLNLKQPKEEVVVVTPEFAPAPAGERSRFARFIPSWLRELFGFLSR